MDYYRVTYHVQGPVTGNYDRYEFFKDLKSAEDAKAEIDTVSSLIKSVDIDTVDFETMKKHISVAQYEKLMDTYVVEPDSTVTCAEGYLYVDLKM